ncbi:MAG: hypothetical protein AB7E60_11975 [Sphingobium sp.]
MHGIVQGGLKSRADELPGGVTGPLSNRFYKKGEVFAAMARHAVCPRLELAGAFSY